MTELICVGSIAGSYGVQGEVRLKSFCGTPEDIATYGPLVTEDGTEYDLALGAPVKAGFAARLSGVRTKEQADALKGVRLHVPRARLPETDEDEFYHVDLIGLDVVDTGGANIGKVKGVIEQGPGDLLEIVMKGQAEPILLPFTKAMVPTVDLTAARVIIDPPEGLLPE